MGIHIQYNSRDEKSRKTQTIVKPYTRCLILKHKHEILDLNLVKLELSWLQNGTSLLVEFYRPDSEKGRFSTPTINMINLQTYCLRSALNSLCIIIVITIPVHIPHLYYHHTTSNRPVDFIAATFIITSHRCHNMQQVFASNHHQLSIGLKKSRAFKSLFCSRDR